MFYALRAPASGTEGQVVWSVDLGDARVMASPTVGPDDTIYVANSNGVLFAIASNGSVRWTAQTGRTVKSAPALGADGTVYHATLDGKLYAVAPPGGGSNQGQVSWTFDFGEHLGPTPLVMGQGAPGSDAIGSGASPTIGPDGTIYIGANNSNFYGITPSGQLKWLFEAERELAGIWTAAALSADGRTLYFGANKGGIYALNAQDGSRRWQFPVFGSIYASSALDARGVLYTGATVEHIFAVDSASGQQVWDYDAHQQVWSAPSIRPDGTLVIIDRSGLVQVLGDQA
jgi:outer membrane protein assembly factor BamB